MKEHVATAMVEVGSGVSEADEPVVSRVVNLVLPLAACAVHAAPES